MSHKHDRKKFCPRKYVDTSVAGEQAIRGSFDEDMFSKKEGFRGFAKTPIVLLERCNIIPFINNYRAVYKQKVDSDARCSEIEQINLHLQKLALRCSVMVVREDLEKLRKEFISKCRNENPANESELSNKSYNVNNSRDDQASKNSKHQNLEISTQPRKRVSFSDRIIVHIVGDYHSCRKCPKIFKDYEYLKLHIRRNHKKRKRYICNYCAKKFLDRFTFKSHIKLHCDICGVLLQSKVQYLEHRLNVCRTKKIYKCKTCNDSYFKLMDLKEHCYEHISKLFVCDICKDQFENKCCLVHHISFLHSERHPAELYTYCKTGGKMHYRCNFCIYSSLEKNVILSHTAVLPDLKNQVTTNYKDYYFCNLCLMRFETETNMLQHRQSHSKIKTTNSSQSKQDGQTAHQSEEQNGIKANNTNENDSREELPTTIVIDDDISEDCVITNSKSSKEKMLYSLLKPSTNGTKNDSDENTVNVNSLDVGSIDYYNPPKKAIVDPRSKKTIISRFNCEICGKYYSSNYTLSRHKATMHKLDTDTGLQCPVCEETFVWPSLLESHKCIRRNIPEMPFEDARAEILFDNLDGNIGYHHPYHQSTEDDGMIDIDFDMPAPIVELTEYSDQFIITEPNQQHNLSYVNNLSTSIMPAPKYKLVVQEVPIEF